MQISEIQIIPIKPQSGLVGFASCVIDNWLYLGSIGIMTRLDGGYRLTYPTKTVGNNSLNVFHPINKKVGTEIEDVITNKYEEVMRGSHDRHNRSNT